MRRFLADAEVSRTKPGSKLDFRLEYDRSKKWTDDDPRDGVGEDVEDVFDDLEVKRWLRRLEKAVKAHWKGEKGALAKVREVADGMRVDLGVDKARTVIRRVRGSVADKKVKEALTVARDKIGADMDRLDRIVGRLARELLMTDRREPWRL